jgi:rhodanese-related sulfurtransferase
LSRSIRTLSLSCLALVLLAIGCSSPSAPAISQEAATVRKVSAADAIAMLGERTVLDVRNPDEFAAGHLAGATNIAVEASDFEARIADLDPERAYLLYCRSGRRSALAADTMAQAGFTDIVDAGALDELLAAGAPLG